jgi:hypothetical protein
LDEVESKCPESRRKQAAKFKWLRTVLDKKTGLVIFKELRNP